MTATPDPAAEDRPRPRRFGRTRDAIYALLWIAGAEAWAAPVLILGAVLVRDLWPGGGDPLGWAALGLPAAAVAAAAVWAAIRTRFSRVAHRRLMWIGGSLATLAGFGAVYWHVRMKGVQAAEKHVMFSGVTEFILAAICLCAAVGGAGFATAGVWGRWVLNRGAAPGVDPGDA